MKKLLSIFVLCSVLVMPAQAQHADTRPDFDVWLQTMRDKAVAEGVSPHTVTQALSNVQPINRVIDLDRKQPEGKWSFAQYKKKIVDPIRVKKGRQMMHLHAAKLAEIERKFGVQPQYVVALWGIETNYGSNTGGFDIIPALATLAWEGRRAEFFTKELIHALKIIDQGHISAASMKGSWAGAMGQNQFMPSSFHSFAYDGDQDGRKDIWTDLDDVFASTANYLSRSGWKAGQRWGRRVIVPSNITEDMVDLKTKKPLATWRDLGVKQVDGSPIPVVDGMMGSLVAPDGLDGEVYLVYNNYNTIMRWNRSTYFATSVGLIADQIVQ